MKLFEFALELATLFITFSFVWSFFASFLIMMGGLLALAVVKDNRLLSSVIFCTNLLGFVLVSSLAVCFIEQSQQGAVDFIPARAAGFVGMTGVICLHFLRAGTWSRSRPRSTLLTYSLGLFSFVLFAWLLPQHQNHLLNQAFVGVIHLVYQVRIIGEALGLFALALLLHSHYLAAVKFRNPPATSVEIALPPESTHHETRKSA